jgi:TRAP-type mannitol/chloroaromatic compound transport system permease small subunit
MITLRVFDKNRGICMPPDARPANKVDLSISLLGQAVSWCVPVMALLVLGIVVLRYGFNTGAIAAQESVQYLHATLFMLGAAVTLGADQHVRVDIFYRRFTARQQAWVNAVGHIIFTLPLCGLIGLGSWDYVTDSWSAKEASPEPGGLPLVFLLKTLIPAMGLLLALQALSLIHRSLELLRRRNSD